MVRSALIAVFITLHISVGKNSVWLRGTSYHVWKLKDVRGFSTMEMIYCNRRRCFCKKLSVERVKSVNFM